MIGESDRAVEISEEWLITSAKRDSSGENDSHLTLISTMSSLQTLMKAVSRSLAVIQELASTCFTSESLKMTSDAESIAQRAKLAFEQSESRLSSLPSSSSASQSSSADAARRSALLSIRDALSKAKDEIQAANAADVAAASELVKQGKLSKSLVSRLDLFAKKGKWEGMLEGVEQVANLPSPLDNCTFAKRLADADSKTGQGAVNLYRITCPIGVLLCIFEARPEVIINIASLAIKSGNAAILKGGKESKQTAAVMSRILSEALADTPLPKDLVQTVETREEIAELLHQDRYIDLVIPRGSNELVRSIQREARMPVMGHADGLCVGYLHEDAEESLSVGTIVDSKVSVLGRFAMQSTADHPLHRPTTQPLATH